MTIQLQKLIFGQIRSRLSRKVVYPEKNGVCKIRSHRLLWAIGSGRASQKPREQDPSLIRCSQSFLRNRSCSFMPGQIILLLLSFFRKISGLKLALTVQPDCWLRFCRLGRIMLDFSGSTTVYLACGVTDLRKSYTGLAAIIKLKFRLDPYSRCMFAFCNRRRTLIKILQWDGSGFWILMKRLDRESFHWPDTPDELQKVTLKEIHWLCDGLSLNPSGAFADRHPKIVV